MRSRPIFAITGALLGAVVDILVNLLAAGIQQRAFPNQFSGQALWVLAGLAVLGLLVGYWLSASIQVPVSAPSQSSSSNTSQPTSMGSNNVDKISISRLRAILSYAKLKGQGIRLSDIVLLGSRIDIDS